MLKYSTRECVDSEKKQTRAKLTANKQSSVRSCTVMTIGENAGSIRKMDVFTINPSTILATSDVLIDTVLLDENAFNKLKRHK